MKDCGCEVCLPGPICDDMCGCEVCPVEGRPEAPTPEPDWEDDARTRADERYASLKEDGWR
jgi:hypothetical protein